MFPDMTPELEFFLWKDYPILAPKMFFSDAPLLQQSRTTQENNTKSGWLSRDSSACWCLLFFSIPLSVHFESRIIYTEK
jgi:hypothetical protein